MSVGFCVSLSVSGFAKFEGTKVALQDKTIPTCQGAAKCPYEDNGIITY